MIIIEVKQQIIFFSVTGLVSVPKKKMNSMVCRSCMYRCPFDSSIVAPFIMTRTMRTTRQSDEWSWLCHNLFAPSSPEDHEAQANPYTPPLHPMVSPLLEEGWTFRWMSDGQEAQRSWAYTDFSCRTIEINHNILERSVSFRQHVLLHECGHAYLPPEEKHGPQWQRLCLETLDMDPRFLRYDWCHVHLRSSFSPLWDISFFIQDQDLMRHGKVGSLQTLRHVRRSVHGSSENQCITIVQDIQSSFKDHGRMTRSKTLRLCPWMMDRSV